MTGVPSKKRDYEGSATEKITGGHSGEACPGERPQEQPNLLTSASWTSRLQHRKKIKSPSLWYFVMAALAD